MAKPITAQPASAAMRGQAGANCQSSSTPGSRQNGSFCRGSVAKPRQHARGRGLVAARDRRIAPQRLAEDGIEPVFVRFLFMPFHFFPLDYARQSAAQILLAAHQ